MAWDVVIYTFEDADGDPATDWTTQSHDEAKRYARQNGYRIVARIFEYAETEVLEDYTDDYCCEGCGRPEDECSRYPCEDVIADRANY